MKSKAPILFLALCLPAQAAEYITASVTFTNAPATGETVTRNGATALWTNGPASSTIWIQTNGPGGSATNLWRFLGANNAALYTRMTSPTNVTISGSGLTFSADAYAVVTLTTNVQTNNTVVTVPLSNQAATNATNIASLLLNGINDHASNSFGTNITALANYLSLGPQVQRASNKVFEASHITGSIVSNSTLANIPSANVGTLIATSLTARAGSLTNFFGTNWQSLEVTNLDVQSRAKLTNVIIHTLTATNFSAPGTAPGSTLIGSVNDSTNATAVGIGQEVTSSTAATVYGTGGSINESPGFVGVGASLIGAQATNAIGIGKDVEITHDNAIVIGPGGASGGSFTTAIGFQSDPSTNYVFGNSTWEDGFIFDTTVSNATVRGVSTVNARVDFTPRANSGLADGNNSGIVLGTNVYVRLSGPSGAYTNAGFAAEVDGSFHILQFDNPVNNLTILDNSGLDATAGNRIRTGTGGNLNFTNNPVTLRVIYDGNASRWRLLDGAPYR